MKITVSFIILTWNSVEDISCCLRSYVTSLLSENIKAEFLIVDNGSSDETVDLVEDIIANLPLGFQGKLFKLPENRGTTFPRNIALREAKGEFIVVCDSDTEFLEGRWKETFNYINNDSSIGILAPSLVFSNGQIQNSVKKFPTIVNKLLKLRRLFKLPEYVGDYYKDFPWNEEREVDTAISACWIFRRKILEEVGFLDEKIFYAPEDLDYCLRVWESNKRVLFYPKIKIMHKLKRISHSKPFSRIAWSHFLGLLYYYKKHQYFFSRNSVYATVRKKLNEH